MADDELLRSAQPWQNDTVTIITPLCAHVCARCVNYGMQTEDLYLSSASGMDVQIVESK